MAVLVVSGSGSGAGKTAVGCAMIRSLPELCWTAVKSTSHRYYPGSSIWEEHNPASSKDTGRYLAAGAQYAFLAEDGAAFMKLESSFVARRFQDCARPGFLLESNSLVPDWLLLEGEEELGLAILNGIPSNWKPSLLDCALRADALVLTGGFCCDQLPTPLHGKRVFQMVPGQWSSPELLDFVRKGLLRKS